VSHVIAGGLVLAGDDFQVLDPGYLVVEDHRIAAMGEGPAPDHAGPVLDARRAIVAPAFLNAHTHVSDGILKEGGFGRAYWEVVMPPDGLRHRAFRETPLDTVRAAMQDTLDYMVSCGTGAFVDFREGGLAGVRVLKEAAAGRGIGAIAMGRFSRYPPQPLEALAKNTGRLTDQDVTEIEQILEAADGFSVVSANDLTDEALSQLRSVVHGRHRLLTLHVTESPPYRDISIKRTGHGDVDRVLAHMHPDFVVHLTAAAPDELDRLAAAGVPAVVCPRIQGVMGNGIPRFDLMLERGMLVALGTDNVMLAAPDLLREVEYSSRVIRGVRRDPAFPSAVQMLQMITVNPARMIRRHDELGSLAVGKRADVVVFDRESRNLRSVRDPVATLVNRAEGRDIKAVIHEGRIVHGSLDRV
jgi:cytosine/adenosine deaminase-related metal-dependent hydrolase